MDDRELIPISALQHYLYCPRQCALIHVEQLWAESRYTAEGRLMHDRADTHRVERRKDVRIITAMPLVHLELGITGVADVVEFHRQAEGERVNPVEYKRGRPKSHRADEVQLCAQAICLEAMLGTRIDHGELFYGQTRRRREVAFNDQLRTLTRQVIADTHCMIADQRTPTASYDAKRCDTCSLIDLCQPRWLDRHEVDVWLRKQLAD